jgi:hypothetical protein
MTTLAPSIARRIVQEVGSAGQPPLYGTQFFTVGLDRYLDTIDEEYLASFIKDGGAAFKMVVGTFGGGKTHFLYSVRDLAWGHHFAVSYVSLKSSGECPFYQLDLVYKAIINGLQPPLPPEELLGGARAGIVAFLRTWYGQRLQHYENHGMSQDAALQAIREDIGQIAEINSISFARAIKAALDALIDNREETFEAICQWLKGEGYNPREHRQHGIQQKIDRTTAFQMIRSLGQVVRQLGYSGLIVLLDEAERVPSLSTKNREQLLSNLREVVDECGHTSFQGVMIFYAVPDENFLEGRTQIYEALKQRVATVFTTINPTGVKIELEQTVREPVPFLCDVGQKLVPIYEAAYQQPLDAAAYQPMIEMIAEWAHDQRFQDEGYKRLFVQKLVQGLHFLRKQGQAPTRHDLSLT